jgi:hypothetical protein
MKWASCYVARLRFCLPDFPLAIPLARWAGRQLGLLAGETGSERIAALDGATLLGERGSANGFIISGKVSAGVGGSRLLPTRDGGWFALTILRPEDRELLPALFLDDTIDIASDAAIARAVASHDCQDLLTRGRDLGLPVASADEVPASAPVSVIARGPPRQRASTHDMSSIWAGPLAGHLLWLAGAEVIKVESLNRPDLIRRDDPLTFDMINQGKANIVVDFASTEQKTALTALIRRADIVIESSRPRALKQLGIDAEALVLEMPGLVWLSITGHGASGDTAHWTGIGNDCGVAAGLSRALVDAGGEIGYVGDAIADPLTGITTALEGWRAYQSGAAQRIGFAMSAIAARALTEERAHDPSALTTELRGWSAALGQPFPPVIRRPMLAEVRPFGADNAQWLPC